MEHDDGIIPDTEDFASRRGREHAPISARLILALLSTSDKHLAKSKRRKSRA
jgi:hypothetical protein